MTVNVPVLGKVSAVKTIADIVAGTTPEPKDEPAVVVKAKNGGATDKPGKT